MRQGTRERASKRLCVQMCTKFHSTTTQQFHHNSPLNSKFHNNSNNNNSYGPIILQSTHGFCIVIILHTFCQLYTHPQANTLDGNRLSDLKANDIGVPTLPYTEHARTHTHTRCTRTKPSICLSSKMCIYIRVMQTCKRARGRQRRVERRRILLILRVFVLKATVNLTI